jgi:hypothetical protein
LVNIVLNSLPKTWDAFAASMNTRKEYITFEELWTCCTQEESMIRTKEKSQNKYNDQDFTTKFKNFKNKRKIGLRKETDETSVVKEREPSNKAKQDKTDFFF